jgi:hypothetical protein
MYFLHLFNKKARFLKGKQAAVFPGDKPRMSTVSSAARQSFDTSAELNLSLYSGSEALCPLVTQSLPFRKRIDISKNGKTDSVLHS